MLDIFDFAIIASLVTTIVFVVKEKEKQALISFVIILALMLIKKILA